MIGYCTRINILRSQLKILLLIKRGHIYIYIYMKITLIVYSYNNPWNSHHSLRLERSIVSPLNLMEGGRFSLLFSWTLAVCSSSFQKELTSCTFLSHCKFLQCNPHSEIELKITMSIYIYIYKKLKHRLHRIG